MRGCPFLCGLFLSIARAEAGITRVRPHVFVLITNNTLELRGETSGKAFITPDQITRMRVGFYETKGGRLYNMKLWTPLTKQPIDLYPTAATRFA